MWRHTVSFSTVRLVPTSDGGFLLAGISNSPKGGMKTSSAFGSFDYWILKLAPEPPRVQAGAKRADGLSLIVSGPTNCVYGIQSTDNCAAESSGWTDVATVTNLTGQVQWMDRKATSVGTRFYRAVKR